MSDNIHPQYDFMPRPRTGGGKRKVAHQRFRKAVLVSVEQGLVDAWERLCFEKKLSKSLMVEEWIREEVEYWHKQGYK